MVIVMFFVGLLVGGMLFREALMVLFVAIGFACMAAAFSEGGSSSSSSSYSGSSSYSSSWGVGNAKSAIDEAGREYQDAVRDVMRRG